MKSSYDLWVNWMIFGNVVPDSTHKLSYGVVLNVFDHGTPRKYYSI